MSIESARLAYVRFKKFPAGHVFIIFRFATGKEVAISPEADVKPGMTFSLLRGFLKTYRLRYFTREPQPFIEEYLRNGRQVKETLLSLSPHELERLYNLMRERGAALEANPEWYHTLFNSCATSVIDHLDTIRGKRHLLPGFLFMAVPSSLGRM